MQETVIKINIQKVKKKIVQVNLWHAKKCHVVGILSFLCIQGILFYSSLKIPMLVLENSLNVLIKFFHEPYIKDKVVIQPSLTLVISRSSYLCHQMQSKQLFMPVVGIS